MARVWRSADRIHVSLTAAEKDLLALLPELIEAVGGEEGDPALERLTPNAYPADPAAADEYRNLAGPELDTARRTDHLAFEASLGDALDDGLPVSRAEAWVRVIGDARLVLATREGIGRHDDLPAASPSHPRLGMVHYLGALQHGIVEALLATMVDP